jgi:hypothetical protein
VETDFFVKIGLRKNATTATGFLVMDVTALAS